MSNRLMLCTALAVVLSISGSAVAQGRSKQIRNGVRIGNVRQLQAIGNPIRVRPVAVAGIDSKFRVMTPWYSTVVDNDWPNGPWTTVFDTAEISPVVPPNPPNTGAPNGEPYENPAYGPAYNVPPNWGLTQPDPGVRLFFGATYNNPFATGDMIIRELYEGAEVQRMAVGWFWNSTTTGERMIVAITTAETYADTDAGFPPPPNGGPNNLSFQGALGGVVLDFGNNQGAGYQSGFYFVNIDVSTGTTPLSWLMPADGNGAHVITLLNSSGTGGSTLATRGQPMLWMSKQTNYGQPGGNPSIGGPGQWDDDTDPVTPANNTPNFIHQTNPPYTQGIERYNYATFTPSFMTANNDVFSAMIGFYSNYGAYAPSSVITTGGFYAGGNAASLRRPDGDRYFVIADELNSTSRVEITFNAQQGTNDGLNLIFATASGRTDQTQFVRLWNGSSWELVDTQPNMTPTDRSVTVELTGDVSRFFNGSNQVRMQIELIPQGDIDAADGWSMNINRATVFVKGAQLN